MFKHLYYSAQLSMSNMEKCYRNKIIIIIIIIQMNDTLRSIEGIPFSHFPSLNEGWRTTKPGSEDVVNTHDLPLQG